MSERTYNNQLRQLHFIDAVNKLRKSFPARSNLRHICALAASAAAPQFYITPRQALDKYWEFKKSGVEPADSPILRAMYRTIFERFEQAIASCKGASFKYSVMQDVLESAAPSFYLVPSKAIFYYYKAMAYKRSLSRK